MAKLWTLIVLVATAALAILWITGVIPGGEIGGLALRTLGVLVVLIFATAAWRVVRGRSDVADKTDQPVP